MLKMILEPPEDRSDRAGLRLLRPEPNCEILNGVPGINPVPGTRHQRIASRLTALLFEMLENKNHGVVLGAPCNVMLSPWDIVQPDILFIRKNRIGIIDERIILGPPDLAVEILSDDSRERDTRVKRRIYADSGVREFWIVDPDAETIESLVWSELGYFSVGCREKNSLFSSPLLSGPELPLSRIFG